jgi:hypothetical protein
MKLTPEQLELLPTDDDVAFYREHGYYVSGKIFSEEEIDDFAFGSERYYAGERDFCLPPSVKAFEGWKPEDGESLRINDYVSLQNTALSELVRHPLIGAIAARLSGSPSIRLWHDQMIYKPVAEVSRETGIGWHTDRAYWMTCASVEMLTAWIPFHDCDETMGTLMVIDESHQWSGDAPIKGFHAKDESGQACNFEIDGRAVKRVPLNLKKGQVSFHHCKTIHGSEPNRSDKPRLSLSVHLQDATNRYREHKLPNGETAWHRNDMLCRMDGGRPDYADPDFCPTLWSV